MFGIKYRYLFITFLAIYSFINIKFTEGDRLFGFELNNLFFFAILFAISLLIWEGNRLIERLQDKLTSLFANKVHYLLLHFGSSVVLVVLVSLISSFSMQTVLNEPLGDTLLHLKLTLGFSFRINLFLNSINAIVFYMNQLKKSQLEAEQLKKQSIEAQFEALRNQINPHFLFNSFNVLSTLVYKDADTSSKFIEQLASVYRYLLYNQENKVVPLKRELEFIHSYVFLLKIRFKENLFVQNGIPEDKKILYIAPATIQMLIENAIKHNVVSKKNPLHIRLAVEGDYFVVSNNLQEKEIKEPSTNVGLNNIKSRYQFLGDKQVEILKGQEDFTVKIPLIELGDI
ncbi:MAG: histidine kinase [Bacteroidota bacterium]